MRVPSRRIRVRVAVGSTTLLVTLNACFDFGKALGKLDLCEGEGPVATVRVNPTPISLRAGDSVQVVAEQLDAKGKIMVICGEAVTWSSVSTSVASVRRDIVFAWVLGVTPGQTSIRADTPTHSGSAVVTVTTQ